MIPLQPMISGHHSILLLNALTRYDRVLARQRPIGLLVDGLVPGVNLTIPASIRGTTRLASARQW